MHLGLTEQQNILRRAARDFLESECPTSLVRLIEDAGDDYSPDLWRKIAALGWPGLGLPEEYQGSAGTVADEVVLFEELGRALAPVPMLVSPVICGRTLLAAGNEEQRRRYIPAVATGDAVMTAALPTAGHPALQARRADGGYRVSGTALFVPYAGVADYVLCPAATADGETLLVVDGSANGLVKSRMDSAANFPQYEAEFRDVATLPGGTIGPGPAGPSALQAALVRAAALQGAESVGRAEKVLEMVVAYSQERVQFGRPIGIFQAIQHRCADLRVAIDGARLLTHQAAWRLDRGEDGSLAAAMALAQANAASREATVAGHSIFAGISYTVEHDMQLYSARSRIAEAFLGGPASQLQAVSALMGLPG